MSALHDSVSARCDFVGQSRNYEFPLVISIVLSFKRYIYQNINLIKEIR